MKERNGFVSNSSSSSFVIIGMQLEYNRNAEELDPYDFSGSKCECDDWYDSLSNFRDGTFQTIVDNENSRLFFGLVLGRSDSQGFEEETVRPMSEIHGLEEKMKVAANKFLKFPHVLPEIKVYTLNVPC